MLHCARLPPSSRARAARAFGTSLTSKAHAVLLESRAGGAPTDASAALDFRKKCRRAGPTTLTAEPLFSSLPQPNDAPPRGGS